MTEQHYGAADGRYDDEDDRLRQAKCCSAGVHHQIILRFHLLKMMLGRDSLIA